MRPRRSSPRPAATAVPISSGARPRVVVVGSGIAGLTAARCASTYAEVTLITKGALEESNTLYAQGGIAAAVFPDDSADEHIADTLRAGAGLCDEDAVRILCTEGAERVRDLIRLGVPFDRSSTPAGCTDDPSAGLARGLEAAHGKARVLHAGGDATGRAIELTLAERVGAAGVTVLAHTMLTDLVVDQGRVSGVRLIDRHSQRLVPAEAVILATGGAGQLFTHTTNPGLATGDGVAAAHRAGAQLADLEFYQFHPTALAVPGGSLISEAVRGEGAVLVNLAGERFMTGIHPDAELAPRDLVARTIAAQMAAQGGRPVLLDATGLGRSALERRFPTIQAACERAGFDWAAAPIPVAPAAHYWMGGIRTDLWARSSLPGLYAVGEAACTGAQGANRLASNSLLEGLVFGARAAEAIGSEVLYRSPIVARTLTRGDLTADPGAEDAARDRARIAAVMWRAAGVERSRAGLEGGLAELEKIRARYLGVEPAGRIPGSTSLGPAGHQCRNLLLLARLLCQAALAREESRGAHQRADFPLTAARAVHSVTGGEAPRHTSAPEPAVLNTGPSVATSGQVAAAC